MARKATPSLARPQNAHAYHPDSTIPDLAAAYAYGLATNDAFVDGNKRVAFLAIGLFLAINGYRLEADQVDGIKTMLALASGEFDEQGLSAWIGKNMSIR